LRHGCASDPFQPSAYDGSEPQAYRRQRPDAGRGGANTNRQGADQREADEPQTNGDEWSATNRRQGDYLDGLPTFLQSRCKGQLGLGAASSSAGSQSRDDAAISRQRSREEFDAIVVRHARLGKE